MHANYHNLIAKRAKQKQGFEFGAAHNLQVTTALKPIKGALCVTDTRVELAVMRCYTYQGWCIVFRAFNVTLTTQHVGLILTVATPRVISLVFYCIQRDELESDWRSEERLHFDFIQ
ncbi:hypothetical protein V6N11_034423 [Hibiscus sabdariffa]